MNKIKLKIIAGILLIGLFCGVACAAPTAYFTTNTSEGDAPLTVQFTDRSSGNITDWAWDFDDGNTDSTAGSTTHTYTTAGTYNAKLTVTDNESNTNSTTKSIKVNAITPVTPVAKFSANTTSGTAPLTVSFTDSSENADIWAWEFGDGNTDSTAGSTTHTYTTAGIYIVNLTVTNSTSSNTNKTSETITVSPNSSSSVTPVAKFSANTTSGTVPLTVSFTDSSENADIWAWEFGDGNTDSTAGSTTHTYTTAGIYIVNLTVTNSTSSNTNKTSETITVSPSSSGSVTPTADFEANVTSGDVPLKVNFTDKSKNADTWAWDFNEDGNVDSTSQNPTYTYSTAGTYNVTLTVKNGTEENSTTKVDYITVHSKYYSSGNRIWDEDAGLSTTYTWNALSYSGFYYDLDTGDYSEKMTISNIKRNIGEGDIEYTTSPLKTKFEHDDWGSYQVIGFMAEKYFAGYDEDNCSFADDDISLIDDGVLSKVLIDTDDKKSMYTGSALELEEGYSLSIEQVDVNGEVVWVKLEKDGDSVDEAFLKSGDDYVYKNDIGDADDVPQIIVHFGTVFSSAETSAVYTEGIFQISDDYEELENGDSFGEMEIKTVSNDKIVMKNDDDINLGEGDTIDLMGNVKIQVADDSTLRFAPYVDTSKEGKYELRGTVYDKNKDDSLPTWTPFNFEGFYYNIDEGIGTEELTFDDKDFTKEDLDDDREIPEGKLIYTSEPQNVDFEHDNWGNFSVIGFMADKYFAGYDEDNCKFADDDVNLIDEGVLTKVLIDTDDKKSMYTGSALELEEGYSLSIEQVDVNGEVVWVKLEKDGDSVDEAFLKSGDDYVYKNDIGDADDVPQIIVHFGTVFSSAETSAVYTEGIFQISDDYKEVESGDSFGEMEVKSVGDSITMKNEDDIDLGKDDTIDLMGNVKIQVADSSTLRFYPFVEIETAGDDDESNKLKISVPKEINVGDDIEIEVTADGDDIEGATVKIDGKTIDTTDENGIVEYSADTEGTFTLTASKEDYTAASKSIDVTVPAEGMSLSVSPETVYVGDKITITAEESIGGDPIEDAEILIDGDSLGQTGSDGTISYTTKEAGKIKITAVKDGYTNESETINVKELEASFKFSNLVISPVEVKAGKEVTISIDAENAGNAAGDYDVELVVSGSTVDSQTISLAAGESTTVTFTHKEEEPGTYNVKIEDQESQYTVTEKSSILLYVVGAFALVIIGGAAYMFSKRGMSTSQLQEKVQEILDNVKTKK